MGVVGNFIWWAVAILFSLKAIFISTDNSILSVGVPIIILGFMFFVLIGYRDLIGLVLQRKAFLWVAGFNFLIVFSFFMSFFNGVFTAESVSVLFKFFTFQALVLFGAFSVLVGKKQRLLTIIFWLSFFHIFGAFLGPLIGLGEEEVGGIIRYNGFAGKVNTLANFALFTVLFYFVQYQDTKRVGYIFLAVLALVVIVLTGTLKNILVVMFLLPFLIFKGKYVFFYFPLVAILSVFSTYLFYDQVLSVIERFNNLVESGVDWDIVYGDNVGNSLNWRILHWKMLLVDWIESYWFFGVGLGGYLSLDGLLASRYTVFDPHNDWLKLLLEFGVFGWIFVVLVFYKICASLFRVRDSIYPAKALLFSYVGLGVAMLAANVIFSLAFFYFMLPVLGVVFFEVYRTKTVAS